MLTDSYEKWPIERFLNSTYSICIMIDERCRFIHRISKGSRFNQIYIPREMEKVFEAGDLVSIELVEKKVQIFCSKNFVLSKFKEKLAEEIFSFLCNFQGIRKIFLVGSFVTQKIDYRDIDLLIVVKDKNEMIENEIYSKLIDKFNLKFHLILIPEGRLERLAEICPLTRSMLYSYISNKKFIMPERKIDKSHIKFLLMMPEDLLKIKANSRVFYDNIRRLITIERFFDNKDINPEKINKELKQTLGNLFEDLRDNGEIDKSIINKLREIIKRKLRNIDRKIR